MLLLLSLLVLVLLAAKALLLVLLSLALVQHLALRPLLSLAGTPAVFPSSSGPPAVAH